MTRPIVLVAEDDADLRSLVALTLADAGIDVDEACNGQEALAHVKERRPDLVLLDMMMPVMDGRTFCTGLHGMGDGVGPTVVVMTAAERAPQLAAEVGAAGWLAKPFDIDELLATVRRFLHGGPLA
jgi:DNA-binding response OmpR family regulator